jgi:VanZ family protein
MKGLSCKMKKLKWILVILWMVIIFAFSSQEAALSNGKSEFVIQMFQTLGLDLNKIFGGQANFVVRKISHFMEYFILGVLLFNAAKGKFKLRKLSLFLILIVFLYSCSDEFHQLFVSGRTSRIRDILIDTAGGIVGFFLCYYISNRNGRKKACQKT